MWIRSTRSMYNCDFTNKHIVQNTKKNPIALTYFTISGIAKWNRNVFAYLQVFNLQHFLPVV